jgi:ABC-type polysaccharide/polyol phosphate transport system ATPase subunit
MVAAAHDLPSIAKLCSKVAWLEHGQVIRIGDCDQVIAEYTQSVHRAPQAPGALAA